MFGSLRIDWNANWDDEVLRSREAREAVEAMGREAVAEGQRLAPVDRPPFGGDYRDSIQSRVVSESGGWRVVCFSDDYKAVWIERGAHSPFYTTPAQHVLQRAVESTGVRVLPGVGG